MSFRLSKGDQRIGGLLEKEGNKLKRWYFLQRKIERVGCRRVRAGGKRAGLCRCHYHPTKEKREDTNEAVHPSHPSHQQLRVGW